jgi:hypothetical protein
MTAFLLPGPDARDNYIRKLGKMRSHQLLLVRKYRDLLPETFRDEEIAVEQLVHGCTFKHVNASGRDRRAWKRGLLAAG